MLGLDKVVGCTFPVPALCAGTERLSIAVLSAAMEKSFTSAISVPLASSRRSERVVIMGEEMASFVAPSQPVEPFF
jgi:hypothetical protein